MEQQMHAIPSNDVDPFTLKPFTAGDPFLGQYETGLYPGGKNEMPPAHRRVGERLASTIRPLAADGTPDRQHGRLLALVLGHSNAQMYFNALAAHLAARSGELHPRFELVNAAVAGKQLQEIAYSEDEPPGQRTGDLSGRDESVWKRARSLLGQPGYSPQQVQVLFLHTTYHGADNLDRLPPPPFPAARRQMQRDLARVLVHCVQAYPNLKLAYLTCDGFRHWTGYEPHVWQDAFGIKWLIESQLRGEPGTACEGAGRCLPWLAWGAYIWDNTWDRSYFTDGVHPAPRALAVFCDKYWQHLAADSVAQRWLFRR